MRSIVDRFPFISLGQALLLARIATAVFFLAHAIGRIAFGTIPNFGRFMEAVGFPDGVAVVWLITISEIVCSLLLIAGQKVRYAVVPLLMVAVGGIALIHARQGWYVGEFGTGGSEYSVALIALLLVIAAADRETRSSV